MDDKNHSNLKCWSNGRFEGESEESVDNEVIIFIEARQLRKFIHERQTHFLALAY